MSGVYKGVGGQKKGVVGGGEELGAKGILHLLLGLFRVAMSPNSASYRLRHAWRA